MHQRVSGSDVISRVMKVRVTTADLDSAPDSVFRFVFLASFSQHHGFHAGNSPALVLRIVFEELLN